jgi:hypothetical protein
MFCKTCQTLHFGQKEPVNLLWLLLAGAFGLFFSLPTLAGNIVLVAYLRDALSAGTGPKEIQSVAIQSLSWLPASRQLRYVAGLNALEVGDLQVVA